MTTVEARDRIMLYLARYGYLAYEDFVTLWVSDSMNYLYKIMTVLCESERKLVQKLSFASDPRYGQLPYLFTLTRKWRDLLVKKFWLRISDIPLRKAYKFHKDYRHRRRTIAIRIVLEKAIREDKWVVIEYLTYFDRLKPLPLSQSIKWTRVILGKSFYIPDSVMHFRTKDWIDLLFCLEMHNGWNVWEIEAELNNHVEILQNGLIASRFNLNVDHRLLSVYQHSSCMMRVLERIKDDGKYKNVLNYMLFKPLQEFLKQPLSGRQTIEGKSVDIQY